MPSDLVWVAIISSAVGVGGAVLSASLAGIVTYNVTRRQTDAQVEGIKEQLKHNADESRRDRIVAARRVYLDSLRQALINWVNSWIALLAHVGNLMLLVTNRDVGPTFVAMTENVGTSQTASNAAAVELNKHLGQISDSILVELINQIWKDENEASGEIQRLARQAHTFGSQLSSGTVQPEAKDEEFKECFAAKERLIDRRQKQYLSINKRVEALLNGDDAA